MACCVVGANSDAADGPLDVFHAGVFGFDFSCGRAAGDENFDLLPPAADGPPYPGISPGDSSPHQLFKVTFVYLGLFQRSVPKPSIVVSKKALRGHNVSSQNSRRLAPTTSTGPATEMSRRPAAGHNGDRSRRPHTPGSRIQQ